MNNKNVIQISNAELQAMVDDLDQINQDVSEPAMKEATAEFIEQIQEEKTAEANEPTNRLGRRTFLVGAGAAVAGGLALAACGGSPSATKSPAGTTPVTNNTLNATDLAVTALATSLENQAVTAYGDAATAVVNDMFGAIPPAATQFALLARTQHAQHGQAWNQILTTAGKAKVTTGPQAGPYSDAIVFPMFQAIFKSGNLVKLLELALALENQAASTYQVGSTVVRETGGIKLAASIQPVEMQHSAILYFVLGKYPGIQDSSGKPLSTMPSNLAAMTSYYTGPI